MAEPAFHLNCTDVGQKCVRGSAFRSRVPSQLWIGAAEARHRAGFAFGFPRDTNRRAEIHQCLVEIEDVFSRNERRGQRPQMTLHRVRLHVALDDEDPVEDPSHVGIEDRGALAEGEAANCPGGVGADALE